MMGDDYAGDDYAGDDYAGDDYAGDFLGEDLLGAAYRAQRARRRGRRGGMRRPPGVLALGRPLQEKPLWRDAQAAPGVQVPTEQLLPLGFNAEGGSPTYVNGGPTAITFTAAPQKPFRGERLVIDVVKSAGASANSVAINAIAVGTDLQIVSAAPLPAVAFSPTAFGVRLALTASQPGIIITIATILVGPALAPGETVTILPVVLGRAIL